MIHSPRPIHNAQFVPREMVTSLSLSDLLKPPGPETERKHIGNSNSRPNLPPLQTVVSVKINTQGKVDEKIISLCKRFIELDPYHIERRAVILHSISQIFDKLDEALKPKTIDMLNKALYSAFSTQPPFSVPLINFKAIFFPQKAHSIDVSLAYTLINKVNAIQNYSVPESLIKKLLMRVSSASVEDRKSAKTFLLSLNNSYTPTVIHNISIAMIPPPLHGMCDYLEICISLIHKVQNPEIINELYKTIKLLHFAPHFQSYSEMVTKTLFAVFDRLPHLAHDARQFLLNHWTRSDPPKSVLFMKEATELCSREPPVDEYTWQRFSWRASSIYIPLALEGLTFVTRTAPYARGYDAAVLRFLLEDTARGHWSPIVRTRAAAVLSTLPDGEKPRAPKRLPIDTWTVLREQARANFPDAQFSSARRRRRPE